MTIAISSHDPRSLKALEIAGSAGQCLKCRAADGSKRLGALAQQPTQPQSSVEIARNSKGVTWVVKAYHPDAVEASTLAQGLDDQLAFRYGQPMDDAA